MKRKLNESSDSIIIDVTAIANDDNTFDFNALRDYYENMGATVGHDDNGHILMIVDGLDYRTVIDALTDRLVTYDPSYIVSNGFDFEDGPEEFEDQDEFEDPMDIIPPFDEEEIEEVERPNHFTFQSARRGNHIETNRFNRFKPVEEFPAYEDVECDDFEPDELSEKRKRCCPGKHKSLNEKLKAFETKDSKKLSDIERRVKNVIDDLDSTTIGAHEARQAFAKLRSENSKLRKIKKNEREFFNINDVTGVKKAFTKLKNADPDTAKEIDKLLKKLTEKINYQLKRGKGYLYENVSINGKKLKMMNVFEIKKLYDKTLLEKKKLSKSIKNAVNESDFTAIKLKLKKYNQLLEYLDNELTYRVVRKRCMRHLSEGLSLNEDGGEISDEELENLFGPTQGEETDDNKEDNSDSKDNSDDSNNEEDEEVELSRIEITLKNKEAAEDLKQACLDADIPEDAIEIEDVDKSDDDSEEDSDENSEDNNDENSEENSDENSEDNSSDDNTSESLYYGNIRKLLFEGEETTDDNSEENPDNNSEENSDDNSDDSSDDNSDEADSNDENSDEEKQVKFILTDTDYALKLADVLNDQYGITKEEFEDMIGGEIVDLDSEDDSDDDSDDNSNDEDNKEDKKDDNGNSENNDDSLMDPSELFKGL